MGILIKMFSKLIRVFIRQPCSKAHVTQPALARKQPQSEMAASITRLKQSGSVMDITDEQVAAFVSRFAFVSQGELPPLDADAQWWSEEMHQSRMRVGGAQAFAWMRPFLQADFGHREGLDCVAMAYGPLEAPALAKALRGLIRVRRMHSEPYTDLLHALYGACVMADFIQALRVGGRDPRELTPHVNVTDLSAVEFDYASMGYQCIESLGETDKKWLVEAFGEPASHQAVEVVFSIPWRNAVSRCYWSEFRKAHDMVPLLGNALQAMQEWMHERIMLAFADHLDWQERLTSSATWGARTHAMLGAAWLATTQTFIVASVGTANLDPQDDPGLEFAALRVSPSGEVLGEFSVGANNRGSLAGASQDAVVHKILFEERAVQEFRRFVGTHPVFFHNAPFNMRNLKRAALDFSNPIHDTLPLARAAWPEFGCYKLAALARHIGSTAFSHRALSSAKATLGVLLAARKVAAPMQFYGGLEPEPQPQRVRLRDFRAPRALSSKHAS